ncbi:SAM-dependent methyltransferase [Nocardiopsis salina]|uniref:SAM-dependent methyltransferase n=1 Tax=Nocardiopsis salina TaxID=245836 RepID=UPI00034C0506|nr:SAM-dependent methyltransferase [Nocardiopsis salina]
MNERIPPGIDMRTPSVARMYDYFLGGKDNFTVDRESADTLLEHIPEIATLSLGNRAFLTRAVDHVARQGVLQYLDLGAGLPTVENTHNVAQRADPRARVVYVDNDPVVLVHGRALLTDRPGTAFVLSDLRDIDGILDSDEVRALIELDVPVCLMLVSMVHCLPDEDRPFDLVRRTMDRLAPGSYLIYSHLVSDDPGTAAWLTEQMNGFGTPWGRVRSPQEAAAAFDGLVPVSAWPDGRDEGPRVVDCASWRHPDFAPVARPQDDKITLWELSGVAYKP